MLKIIVKNPLVLATFLVLALLIQIPLTGFAGDGGYAKKAHAYEPNPDAVLRLKQIDQPTKIVLFHGTWCKDCQREIPRFNKVMELVDNPKITITEYNVNQQKQDVLGKFKEYGIQLVPTFIVIQNGKELGRITEKPEKSLEEDLAAILKSKD